MSGERLLVVGLDDSPGGCRALSWALRHARNTGATVQVVTAYLSCHDRGHASDRREQAVARQRTIVEAAVAEMPDPPVVSMEVVDDFPVEALVRASRQADMLVLGPRARNRLGEVIIGPVSTGCMRGAATAVTVVPMTDENAPREELIALGQLSEV